MSQTVKQLREITPNICLFLSLSFSLSLLICQLVFFLATPLRYLSFYAYISISHSLKISISTSFISIFISFLKDNYFYSLVPVVEQNEDNQTSSKQEDDIKARQDQSPTVQQEQQVQPKPMSFFKRKMIERGLLPPPEPDEQDRTEDPQDQTKDRQDQNESRSKTTAQQDKDERPQQESFCKRKMRVMFLVVFILDGSIERSAHVWSKIGNLIYC